MFTTLTIALASLSLSLTQYQTAQASIQPPQEIARPQMTMEEQLVRLEFWDAPEMIEVARCESNFTQYENGKPLKGRITKDDTGIFQISEKYHPDAKGIVETLEGNLRYARHLYELRGTKDWQSSRTCWDREV